MCAALLLLLCWPDQTLQPCTSKPCPHLLVDLSAVVEAVLTSAGHAPLQASRVPCADAGHLAQTPMGLAGQAGDAPASDHTLSPATLGDGDRVNHLVGLEHAVHGHGLRELGSWGGRWG